MMISNINSKTQIESLIRYHKEILDNLYDKRVQIVETENEQLKSKINDGWLNISKASKYAGVSRTTFYKWIDGGLRTENGRTKKTWIDEYRSKDNTN